MPTKTAVKKPLKKNIKKAPKKSSWGTIEEGFKQLQKSQDEAWKVHRETEKSLKKSQDEAWAAIRETQKSSKKSHDETWAAIKETQKNIGGLNNTLGSMVERIMTPALPQKFKSLGFTFDKITTVQWAAQGNIYAELDGLLENGTQAMVVEVKTTLEIEDINAHIKRMEKVRKYADDHNDKREFLGAIAAMVIKPKPRDYALNQGFFLIEPSGDDVKVIKPEGKPKIW
ncbi:hypothetical protein R84B8_00648 [Treponema sp. R8-4-B8]